MYACSFAYIFFVLTFGVLCVLFVVVVVVVVVFLYTIALSEYVNFTYACMPGVCTYVHLLKN